MPLRDDDPEGTEVAETRHVNDEMAVLRETIELLQARNDGLTGARNQALAALWYAHGREPGPRDHCPTCRQPGYGPCVLTNTWAKAVLIELGITS